MYIILTRILKVFYLKYLNPRFRFYYITNLKYFYNTTNVCIKAKDLKNFVFTKCLRLFKAFYGIKDFK